MYAVLREDFADAAHKDLIGVGIVCETLVTIQDAKDIAAIGARDYATDGGFHRFTVHPAKVLRRRLAKEGWADA